MNEERAEKPMVLVVCGPTASGKTAFAIELAKRLNTQIISADSRQCYRALNIGVARPTAQELAAVPHHFVATHSIETTADAALFARLGQAIIAQNHSQAKPTLVAGGSGLYIQALIDGLHEMPPTNLSLRSSLTEAYKNQGLHWLQAQILEADPVWAAQGEMQNPARILRALEVVRHTGKSITQYWHTQKNHPSYHVLYLALDWPKEELHARIARRVKQMINNGLEAEASAMMPHAHHPALQTVGYKEWFACWNGACIEADVPALIDLHTRQYAKRQITWCKRMENVHWLHPEALDTAFEQLVLPWMHRR